MLKKIQFKLIRIKYAGKSIGGNIRVNIEILDNLDRSSRAKTWFRIGHEGERYLHTGGRSLGCVTITEVEKWNEIYNKLIKARKGDFLSVGVLEVID